MSATRCCLLAIFVLTATTPELTSQSRNVRLAVWESAPTSESSVSFLPKCRDDEWSCGGGECVQLTEACDGYDDCPDGSDEGERACAQRNSTQLARRRRRQAAPCVPRREWTCADGSCVPTSVRCDAVTDCPDGSDETLDECGDIECESYLFRCTYGACVPLTARCNNVKECPDGSDEEFCQAAKPAVPSNCGKKFTCDDGSCIKKTEVCDGVVNCDDGSDETMRRCRDNVCPNYQFKCAYGACINKNLECNGVYDCIDYSDEDRWRCGKEPPPRPDVKPTTKPTTATTTTSTTTTRPVPRGDGICRVPKRPDDGYYNQSSFLGRVPEEGILLPRDAIIDIYCRSGFGLTGRSYMRCLGTGQWDQETPECLKMCKPRELTTTKLRCFYRGLEVDCSKPQKHETIMRATCVEGHKPDRYSNLIVGCFEGSWNATPRCVPDCGLETGDGRGLTLRGVKAIRGQLPWHVVIYELSAETGEYDQICGGSIVSNKYVVSAAHCVWSEANHKMKNTTLFVVAVAKFFREFDNEQDAQNPYMQRSNLRAMHIPDAYTGEGQNYQADIVLMEVSSTLQFSQFVTAVCVEFEEDDFVLVSGTTGRAAGMGLTSEGGEASPELRYVDLPVKSVDECRANMPSSFHRYLTTDKVCAGYVNGTGVCSGDSGGGLVFPGASFQMSMRRWYLRGIVSVGAPSSRSAVQSCRNDTYAAFTKLKSYEKWFQTIVNVP